jgi:phage terminase small subunit
MALTQKQQLFCELYAGNGGNGTQAAIGAGYSADTAKQMASENLTKPDVTEYLQTLTKPMHDELIACAVEQQRFFTSTMRDTKQKIDARLKACETLGKMQGNYKDKLELSGTVQMPIVIEIAGV